MIGDMWAVMLKEWRELYYLHTKGGKTLWFFALFLCIVLGIVLRRILQPSSVQSPVLIAVSTYLSFLPVASIIADSFAGERERHTIETLLASRLSSRSILFGKMLAAIAYGWTVTLLFLALFLAIQCLLVAALIRALASAPRGSPRRAAAWAGLALMAGIHLYGMTNYSLRRNVGFEVWMAFAVVQAAAAGWLTERTGNPEESELEAAE